MFLNHDIFEHCGYVYPENPTLKNTDYHFFNCGGYATESYKWYLPFENREFMDDLFCNALFNTAENIMVENIKKDFGYECIDSDQILSLKTTHQIIAFRIQDEASFAWDFHFAKLGKNGNWYEKPGGAPYINRHPYSWVFNHYWNGRYDGTIFFLARKRV